MWMGGNAGLAVRSGVDRTVRMRSARPVGPAKPVETADGAVAITVADCSASRDAANRLLNKMYAWRGYGAEHEIPSGPNCTTFMAMADGDLAGTLTLRVDAAGGLSADDTFADTLDTFRAMPGASICELTKFAFDASSPARPRLAALFHTVLIYGSVHHRCTDLFIEVNPRHRGFYEAMLGFRAVAEPRTNTSVGAPSHLLWLNVDEIRNNIARHRGAINERVRSLYPYFLSPDEEQRIAALLANRRSTTQSPTLGTITVTHHS